MGLRRDRIPNPTRRSLLSGIAGGSAVMTAGCVQRARSLLNRNSSRKLSLTVKTVPADEDQTATAIARSLVTNLTQAGIHAEVVLLDESELRRDVLINHEFDMYVSRYPGHHDPDFLRPLFHSRFNGEPGWQNPFGFTDLAVDERLRDQFRTTGSDRRSVVFELLQEVARQQPMAVVGFPNEIRAARTDRFSGWTELPLSDPLSYLILRRHDTDGGEQASDELRRLRVTITDDRVTRNFNPLAVEYRNRGTFASLLYDPLARWIDGHVRPWMARGWTWSTDGGRSTATVELRDDLHWHDGDPLTVSDVQFTYRFLSDTTLGNRDSPIPAPRFRGRTSLVRSVEPIDGRRLRFDFGEAVPEVARRAFTVPVLPAHVWEPKAREVDIAGLELFDGITEALVWENPSPIGSGPFEFDRSIPEELLVLTTFAGHFLHRESSGELDAELPDAPAFDELVARVVPSDAAAIELIAAGEADATASSVDPSGVPRIGLSEDLQLLVDESSAFYHVGFNTRRSPLSNQRFRRTVARLIDKETITRDVYDGYLTAAAVPVSGAEWIPTDLRWDGRDPEVPFVGEEGELDSAEARALFRDAGYEYNDEGRLVIR